MKIFSGIIRGFGIAFICLVFVIPYALIWLIVDLIFIGDLKGWYQCFIKKPDDWGEFPQD